jgi:HEAT repeat protein
LLVGHGRRARLLLLLLLAPSAGCQGWKAGPAISRWLTDVTQADASKADDAANAKKTEAELDSRRQSPSPRLRAAAMAEIAKQRPPKAAAWLSTAANGDIDLQVRLAAIAGLGALATPDSQAALTKLAHAPGEGIRAAAIQSLAECGPDPAVFEAAKDRSRRVRLAVAGAVARYPSPEAATAAERLLADASVEIQCRVVASVAKWPPETAGPVLFEALARSAYTTRKAAAEQLTARWAAAGEYQVDAPPERRAEVVERLRLQYVRQFPPVARAALPLAPVVAVSPETLATAEGCVQSLSTGQLDTVQRQRAIAALDAMGADLVPALTALVVEKHAVLPEVVYTELLPRRDPVFAQITLLKSPAVTERRQAAEGLAQALAKRPCGLLVAERLASILIAEPDPLVLEIMLGALAQEPGEPAMRVARSAMNHRAAEVRRRACLNLALHPRAEDEKLLARMLGDSSSAVAIAAAQGLGALGRVEDAEPLRDAARKAAEPLRSEAVIAMARLGDPAGYDGLLRLGSSGDPILRRRAALAMGELGDTRFAGPLSAMLHDRPAVQHAALESLKQIAGRDVAADGGSPADASEVARRWKHWADHQSVR